jgi:formylmethanofuran dehydrogenase subunit E
MYAMCVVGVRHPTDQEVPPVKLYEIDRRLNVLSRERAQILSQRPLAEVFKDDPATIERFGAERIAQADREAEEQNAARLAEIATEVARLEALAAETAKTACNRCRGTGEYHAPTSHTVQGRPVCFACGGTGVRKGRS